MKDGAIYYKYKKVMVALIMQSRILLMCGGKIVAVNL
jgi:hypothetical protein